MHFNSFFEAGPRSVYILYTALVYPSPLASCVCPLSDSFCVFFPWFIFEPFCISWPKVYILYVYTALFHAPFRCPHLAFCPVFFVCATLVHPMPLSLLASSPPSDSLFMYSSDTFLLMYIPSDIVFNVSPRSVNCFAVDRSTPLVLAVQQGHVEAARALIEAGARIDIIPRGEDGTELAPSLARLAADMKRADMVALLVKAVVKRDSSESWTREWAATVGVGVAKGGREKEGRNGAAVALKAGSS